MITNHGAKILAFLQTFELHSGVFQVRCFAFCMSRWNWSGLSFYIKGLIWHLFGRNSWQISIDVQKIPLERYLSHPRVYKINKEEGYSRVPRLSRTRYSAKGSAKAMEICKRDCKAPSSGENHIWSCGRHTDFSVGVSIFLIKLSLLSPNFLAFLDFVVAAFIRTDRRTDVALQTLLVIPYRVGNLAYTCYILSNEY